MSRSSNVGTLVSYRASLLFLFLAILNLIDAQTLPKGYRFPTESDHLDSWRKFRADLPVLFHITADINGDALIWVLKSFRPVSTRRRAEKAISNAKEQRSPPTLTLQNPAINFFLYESASSYFWWDTTTSRFRRTWMSD
jgi:hypothetical protein